MQNTSRIRTAGIIGMGGAVLWLITIVMRFGLGPDLDNGPLYVVHELIAFTALASINLGFLGLIWGGVFRGRLGTLAVWVHICAYGLIVLGGLAALLLGEAAGPLFVLFPIGGALEGGAAMLLAAAALTATHWAGWQRWIPLLYGLHQVIVVGLPMLMGAAPDGPGLSVEAATGAWWFLVGLAAYTTHARAATHASAASQV